MSVKVGINGFGRIGRNMLRNAFGDTDIEVLAVNVGAVNDLPDTQPLAHLLKYDSLLRNQYHQVSATENASSVDCEEFKVFSQGTSELQQSSTHRIEELRGAAQSRCLDPATQTISREDFQLPGPDFIGRVWALSDTAFSTLKSLLTMFRSGRLVGTGYFEFCSQGHEEVVGIGTLQSIPLLFRKDSGEQQTKHSVLHRCQPALFYADRKTSRRWQEWALERNKILFFSELTIVGVSIVGTIIVLTYYSGISSIATIAAFLGIGRMALKHLSQSG
jgi:glyceraldehyde 3-phosphate dehydrogenase-like protein